MLASSWWLWGFLLGWALCRDFGKLIFRLWEDIATVIFLLEIISKWSSSRTDLLISFPMLLLISGCSPLSTLLKDEFVYLRSVCGSGDDWVGLRQLRLLFPEFEFLFVQFDVLLEFIGALIDAAACAIVGCFGMECMGIFAYWITFLIIFIVVFIYTIENWGAVIQWGNFAFTDQLNALFGKIDTPPLARIRLTHTYLHGPVVKGYFKATLLAKVERVQSFNRINSDWSVFDLETGTLAMVLFWELPINNARPG